MAILSPILAVVLTVVTGFFIFWAVGLDPFLALYVYFVDPLTHAWSMQELLVKAIPITMIAIGLAFCYLANTWNIGAEGQLVVGAIFGSAIPVLFPEWQTPLTLPLMLLMGILGGMVYAAIPATLKVRFGTNEILTSLMLVYVANLLLDWLVRGPWRNPEGYNFPGSVDFSDAATMPILFGMGRLHLGLVFVIIAIVVAWFALRRTITGFEINVLGQAPRAGAFAGFSRNRMVFITFLISGGLAGLAGIQEVAGPIGKLDVVISPGYGFTAIIVAFLGRLNPLAIPVAGFVLALSYLGGESAQIMLGLSGKTARVFQGILLFYVLACDSFILYRLRFVRSPRATTVEAAT
jgi:simple sugar transport system permease protein